MNTIPESLEELKKGNMLILLDSADRENQGDLIFAAESVTPEKINFLLQKCKGMICVPITKAKAKQLNLPLMVSPSLNTEQTQVNFTVTVDVKTVTSFGISAADRSQTIQALAHKQTKPTDLVRPGHIFPLLARNGGVLERDGHTEATIELLQLASCNPTGVLCEILNDQGNVANLSELQTFASEHQIKIVSIPDLITYVKN